MQENPEFQEKKEPKESDFKAPGELETGYTEKSWEKPEKTMEEKEAVDSMYQERKEPKESDFKETGYTEKSWEKPEKTMEETREEIRTEIGGGTREGTGEETREEKRTVYKMEKRLTRSKTNRMLFGVCGGLGKYFGIDPTLVRLGFVLLALLDGIGVVIYIILAIIMPQEEDVHVMTETRKSS
ncbi:MAG: PspC domain-containing protein [Methanosarcina sp.]|jgi:phage shock protein PspC (stress-responsive transcriptional regulator)